MASAPEGREGQSQAGPKGPKPTRRASKLLVHTYWHVYNVMIQMIQRCNLLSLDGCCPFHLSVTRDQGLLLIILVQFQEIRHLIWVFTAAKRIHRVFLFRTPMPPPSIHHHPHETREHLTTYHHHCNHQTRNSIASATSINDHLCIRPRNAPIMKISTKRKIISQAQPMKISVQCKMQKENSIWRAQPLAIWSYSPSAELSALVRGQQ